MFGKKNKSQEKREKVQKVETTEPKNELLTYLGPGPLSGEYRFKEIAGSIAATSVEEAIQKANEIAIKQPSLLIK